MNRDKNMLKKLYLIKINRLEQSRIKTKEQKRDCVKAQDYETAIKLRDKEHDIMYMLDRLNELIKLTNK